MSRVLLFILPLLLSCTAMENPKLDIQGHRGCRGLMPENTIPAFVKALELGVTTLELDLVISADKKVVVSHEPYFKSAYSLDPNGNIIAKADEKNHNLYQMPYDSIKLYDVGTKVDSTFATSKRVSTYKPLYSELISTVKQWCSDNNQPIPFFNIEIKRVAELDNKYHPEAEEFAALVMEQVQLSGLEEKTIIQSFDFESLRIVKREMPEITLVQLIETRNTPEDNVKELGFTPDIYSCYFKMVDEHLIQYAKSQNIKVIPWTVNMPKDIQAMIDIGVDGIISDYPDRVIAKAW